MIIKILIITEIILFFVRFFIRNYIRNDSEERIKATLNDSKLDTIQATLAIPFYLLLIIILVMIVISL